MTCNRGDVVLVIFPNSDLVTAKQRPAVVVQAEALATGLTQTVLALVTSNLVRAGNPSRVTVLHGTAEALLAGLRTDSVIMADNLATVLDTLIVRVIGKIADMSAVDAALRHTLASN